MAASWRYRYGLDLLSRDVLLLIAGVATHNTTLSQR
jgi:hypothetical protein